MGTRTQGAAASAQEELRIVRGPDAGYDDGLPSRLLPWVLDAAQPYARCLYGDDGTAAAVYAATMRRRGSELSPERAAVLMNAHEPCGIYFAVPGAELSRSRRHEFVEAMRLLRPGGLADLRGRMDALDGIFPPVSCDEFYLSKLAIAPGMRRQGFAQALLRHYLRLGSSLGFRRFRLDVSDGNTAAVRLYERQGFCVSARKRVEFYGLEYLSMTLTL